MGLDNIPAKYACESVAIRTEDGKIDCDETMANNLCPWQNEKEKSSKKLHPAYGMFGVPCWYRGKHGNFLLSLLESEGNPYHENSDGFSFYGNGRSEGEGISVEGCLELASYMTNNTDKLKNKLAGRPDAQEYLEDWDYAIWWLEFVAEYCDGSSIWY